MGEESDSLDRVMRRLQRENIYYDKEGCSLSSKEFSAKFDDMEYRRIAEKESEKYRVSTVWVGINLNIFRFPLLIFETMVFSLPDYDTEHCERYSTLEEAKAGHEEALKMFNMDD